MGKLRRWLWSRWHARCRQIDLEILWPACRRVTPDIDRARAAFACHALHDRAWMVLGEDEVCRLIDGLK